MKHYLLLFLYNNFSKKQMCKEKITKKKNGINR
jgi:hypothetical protein